MKNFDLKKNAIRVIKLVSLTVICLLTMAIFSFGQYQSSTSENKSDQNLKSMARVNPSTLAMEFSIPLGAYPGRNGNSLPMNFTYSSKVWESKVGGSQYADNRMTTGGINDFIVASFKYSNKSLAGWSHSLEPPRVIEPFSTFIEHPSMGINFWLETQFNDETFLQLNSIIENLTTSSSLEACDSYVTLDGYICTFCLRQLDNDTYIGSTACRAHTIPLDTTTRGPVGGPPPNPTPNNRILVFVKRKKVQMPDGSIVEFRADDNICQFSFSTPPTPTPCLGGGEAYLSVDGSRMRLQRTEVQPGVFREVLYLPNGDRYIFSTSDGVTRGSEFIDKDGNKSVYDPVQKIWTDTMGRQILNPFPDLVKNQTNPQTESPQTLSLPSLPGTNLQAQFFWKKLKTEGCETDTTGSCGESVLEDPAQELPYIGSENCATPWTDNVNQPSLFQGTQWTSTTPHTTYYKENVCGAAGRFNPVVLKEVILPDGKKYEFKYNLYGEISWIKYPSGVVERFTYAFVPPVGFGMRNTFEKSNRGVIRRKVYLNEQDALNDNANECRQSGDTSEQCWKYAVELVPNPINPDYVPLYSVKITAPDESYSERFIYRSNERPYGFSSHLGGMTYEEKTYSAPDANNVQKLTSRTLTEWTEDGPLPGGESYATRNPRQLREIVIAFEGDKALAVMSENDYENPEEINSTAPTDLLYFAKLNIKRVKAYNYLSLDFNLAKSDSLENIKNQFHQSGQVANISETDYLYDPNYKSKGIPSLPKEIRVMDPSSPTQVLSRSQIVYDEQSQYYSMMNISSTVGYEAPTGDYAHLRGNATTHRTWFAEENRWIETHTQYDNFGNMRKAWDSSGDPNRFIETEYSSQHHYAYPTRKITKGPGDGMRGTTENSTITADYDPLTGLITSVTDSNGQVTTTEYDHLLRPKRVIPPAGGGISEKIYGDTPGNYFVTTKTQVDAQNWAETTAFFDNLGRVYKTQTKDRQGDIFAEVKYDNFGRVEKVSNPYRQGEQKYWSKPRYDNRGRVVETYAPAPDGQTGASIGTVEFGISTISGLIGNYITATDASGRKARSFTNVYGQVVRVDEPTGNNALGTLENPNQASYYHYNVKGELVKVQQGQQNRYFMYDSLGRLIRVRQPEQTPHAGLATTGNPDNNQWTSGFTYDVFGNVITVKDANGLTITNEYDKAGRVTKSIYSDGTTPQVDYYYDGTGLGLPQPPQFSKGSLTKISNGVSETRYTSFDNYGRVLTNQQITDGQTFDFQYKYDAIGNLIEQTYPSMRVVKTHLDSDGGLAAVSSKTANSPFKTYASNFDYTATGSIKAMMLGNGRWETAVFNERQQIEQIGLGNTATDTSLWKVNYDYGELNTDGSVDANKNIGMVAKQTITLPTAAFVQTYKYDALNRLVEAKENANTTSGAENWKQTFGYDRYGNRTDFYQKVGNNVLTINNITKPQIDPATNRFTTAQGYVYDFNGNLIQDAENRQFAYNGDDQQKEVRDLNIPTSEQNPDANVIGRYYYDGEGKRVKKVTNFETTIFVYDGAGDLVAEYSTQTNPEPTTSYMTTDNLGSPRVVTDKNGNVISRRDFMPFGEELTAGVGARDTNQKYSATGIDNIRQRFTGYEKDIETDLDFAEARMYKNRHARFTSPDPLLSSASLGNPQTFNRYVYVGNNPVNLTDPSGLSWCRNQGDSEIKWSNGNCDSGWDNVDGKYGIVKTVGPAFAKAGANEGNVVRYNANGTITVISNPTDAQWAQATGTEVQAESNPVEVSQDIALGTSIASVPVQQDLLPLPCQNGHPCNKIMPLPLPSLDRSNVEPLKSVEGIIRIAELCSMAPVAGAPCGAIAAIGRFGQGNFRGASENVLAALPLAKPLTSISKVAPISLTTHSKLTNLSRRYTIYTADGQLYKFGVTDANFFRMKQSLAEAGHGAYARFTQIVTKAEAHIGEKYIRSLHYASTGKYRLPGMKRPYPYDLITGKRIKPPK